ncbi:MAG: bacillithiol biosynthesis deacetylase BshB1 [Gemmatimonadetes bacterium]|nr:bacillithiol biosynthesis deacetylase BshB1 [Gemmatimonadota bacterium]
MDTDLQVKPLDVLAVMAHPDDAELLCGGALIKAVDEGARVGVLDLTGGEAGSAGSAALRAEEAAAAARVMGLSYRGTAGLPDAALVNSTDARRIVAGHLRILRPRIVVTHFTEGRHPDHRAAASLVTDSCFLAGLKKLQADGAPHRPLKVVHALTYREDDVKPTFVIDITDQMDRKLEALRCYGSQFDERTGMGEVYPAGDRPLYDQIRAAHAGYGSRIRAGYGEPYWTRETMVQDSLTGLAVSTF